MLLTDQDHKMISLMTLLYRNNNKWIKLNDLAIHLSVSKKTVHTYLDKLQKIFFDYGEFYSAGSMVKVNLSPNFGIITAQRTFLNQSVIVRVLKMAFFNSWVNKFDLSIELDVSESSIYRSIKSFNEVIEGVYDLNFSYADMTFEGSEIEIQKFYINFFIETNPDPTYWMFGDYFKEEYANTISKEIIKFLKPKIHTSHYEYLKVAIAIAIIRLKQGHKIPVESYNEGILKHLRKISSNEKVRKIIEKEFPDSKNETCELIYDILAYFLSQDYFLIFVGQQNKIKDVLISRENYQFYLSKLGYLCDKYNLEIDDPFNFYYEMFANFKFKITNIDSVDFFINHSDKLLTYVKFFNIELYRDIEKILISYMKIYHPTIKYDVENLIYSIYTIWPNLISQILKAKINVKALIISRYDYYFSKTIKSMIDLSIAHPMQVDIYEDYEIDFNKIKELDYNVIIVDFPVKEDLGDKLIFSFEDLPTFERIQELFKQLGYKSMDRMVCENPEDFKSFRQIIGMLKDYR